MRDAPRWRALLVAAVASGAAGGLAALVAGRWLAAPRAAADFGLWFALVSNLLAWGAFAWLARWIGRARPHLPPVAASRRAELGLGLAVGLVAGTLIADTLVAAARLVARFAAAR